MIAGTDPSNPAEFFRVIDLQQQGENITLNWPSVSGKSYQVRWSTNMLNWNPSSIHAGTGAELEATLNRATIGPANASRLFLRVSILPSD